MDAPALRKHERLVAVRLGAEKGADLINDVAETRSGGEGFEPARGAVALLHALMILFQMVIQIAVRPVDHVVSENVPNGTWVRIMAIRGDAIWGYASHGPGGAKEGLSRW